MWMNFSCLYIYVYVCSVSVYIHRYRDTWHMCVHVHTHTHKAWGRHEGRRVLRCCYWVPWLKKKNVGLEMVFLWGLFVESKHLSGLQFWNPPLWVKKKKIHNTFNLEAEKAIQLLETHLGWGKCRWMKWILRVWISNTNIDLNIDWGCVDDCVWAPSPALSPRGRGLIRGCSCEAGMKEEGQRGPVPWGGKDPNILFQ